jgi:hypothetical protein
MLMKLLRPMIALLVAQSISAATLVSGSAIVDFDAGPGGPNGGLMMSLSGPGIAVSTSTLPNNIGNWLTCSTGCSFGGDSRRAFLGGAAMIGSFSSVWFSVQLFGDISFMTGTLDVYQSWDSVTPTATAEISTYVSAGPSLTIGPHATERHFQFLTAPAVPEPGFLPVFLLLAGLAAATRLLKGRRSLIQDSNGSGPFGAAPEGN